MKAFLLRRALPALLIALATPLALQAQTFPAQQVQIVVPYPAGGTADVLGRELAERLSRAWGRPVIVDNKAGAGGAIGVDLVAKARPDGHQLVLGVTGALTIAPHLRKLPYDPLRDLAPVSLVGASPSMLAVHPSVAANSVSELIALAKAQPGKLSFSSAGIGTSVHIAGELFKSMAGIDILHVPYKGGAPSVQGLLAGEVAMTFENISILQPHVQAGKVKGLAVTSASRSSQADRLPPVAQTLPGYQVTTWFGLFAPAGTPADVVSKLHRDVVEALSDAPLRSKLAGLGIDVIASTPAALAEHMQAENRRFAKVIQDANIKAE
jgi:tripartite-type tricarboxylate transporter receptor subunit TctC